MRKRVIEKFNPTIMKITTEQVKELRNQTGISIMQCKKALEEAKGDMDKAVVILNSKRGEAASKKSDRSLGAGTIQAYIHSKGSAGAMVELSCETDFVANNEEFRALAYDIAMHVTASDPQFLSVSDVDEESKKTASEVFAEEVKDKPKELRDKILQGKIDSYFSERILIEQPFIKDPGVKIKDIVDSAIHKFGERIEISRFIRFSI
jgi:elongation factor Ts